MIAWLSESEVNKTPAWSTDSGERREGSVFEERKRGGCRIGRRDAKAMWSGKSIQTFERPGSPQHSRQDTEHLGLSGPRQSWQLITYVI